MKAEKKWLYSVFPYAVFALFLGLQAIPVFSLPLFGDDYYYATFVSSARHFVAENILHYQEVNGRVLVHLFDELLLADRSLTLFGIVDWLVIGTVVFFGAAIGARCYRFGFRTRRFAAALPVACLLFTVLSLETLRTTVYWATGATNYLFPLALLFVFAYFLLAGLERKTLGRAAAIILPILAFLVGESTEQASAAVCAIALFGVWRASKLPKAERNRLFRVSLTSLLCGIIGFAILFLAPGNRVRETFYPDFYAKPLLSRVLDNVKPVVNYSIGQWSGAAYTVPVLLLLAAYAYLLASRAGGWQRVLMRFAFPAAVTTAALLIVLDATESEDLPVWTFYAVCYGVVLAAAFAVFLADYIADPTHVAGAFVLLAVLLQMAMLLSPEMGARTCLCSFLLLGVAALTGAAELAEAAAQCGWTRAVCAALGIAAVVWMTWRGYDTAVRYHGNVPTYRANEQEVERWLAVGDETKPLVFYMPPDNRYRYILPYDNDYHAMMYKRLYGIPDDVAYHFDFYNP